MNLVCGKNLGRESQVADDKNTLKSQSGPSVGSTTSSYCLNERLPWTKLVYFCNLPEKTQWNHIGGIHRYRANCIMGNTSKQLCNNSLQFCFYCTFHNICLSKAAFKGTGPKNPETPIETTNGHSRKEKTPNNGKDEDSAGETNPTLASLIWHMYIYF